MTVSALTLMIPSPDHMTKLAQTIASALRPGDCILLSGDIGVGKSHFARAAIQSLLPTPEDVPSPTFTLVQVYDGPLCEIWHSDLYRLSAVDEIYELGLVDAFDHHITLVEWPDRLETETPDHALNIAFDLCTVSDDARHLSLTWSHPKWAPLMKKITDDHA
ncbi:tRNA (adenosine(37)-N6)-threonylcarbamoyltransferase complex ATPase subunit type 1 TsaE [Epibacterium sp. SM1969]|uniref:tRNA threonylcarbamoyladenosine biosynthesis protein TsaE n=1 Tax=Tritonibacter aquimaris TaxID=2663379 RepID=A0A844AXD0_9RHOB|nr:tRNA (adenosine(37)-N6)-threonylcarbamoyltransferase complex ATPase subunit type 1 TsaE [Tritonibacter aquimaris]MQY41836.1 tRNA (adenosine(37)-N6)-threonylcarbamoyltransferase complex ATPase subunit type 1 TsaE [Tritonibacter aquimaris]